MIPKICRDRRDALRCLLSKGSMSMMAMYVAPLQALEKEEPRACAVYAWQHIYKYSTTCTHLGVALHVVTYAMWEDRSHRWSMDPHAARCPCIHCLCLFSVTNY
jgi:Rieske Fe-S protein